MESTSCNTREERAQRRALKRDNRGGNADSNMEEGARSDVEEVRGAAGGGGRAHRRRGGQASVRGRSVGDDLEVLQFAVAPGDQDVEEIRDEGEGEVHEVLEDIDAADPAVREVIDLEEEDDVVDVGVLVAQVEEEVNDQEAVGVAEEGIEEIIYEGAVGQIGDGQDDEEEHLEERDDLSTEEQVEVAEADLEDGPALSATIDLTDSPRPNRMSLEPLQCPICLDPLRGLPSWKEVHSTPCGHLFCNTCLVTALRSAWQCPTCRRRTRAEEAIKIFL